MSVPRQGVEPCFAWRPSNARPQDGEISHKGACWEVCRVPPRPPWQKNAARLTADRANI